MSDIELDRAHGLDLLAQMILVRRFEQRCAEAYQQQKIRGFLHLYDGEEAIAVGAIATLRHDDAIVATYREHAHALVRGIPADTILAEMYGKATGCARGHGGSMHLFSAERRFYGGYAIVGGGLPIAVGLALAEKLLGRDRIVACFFGDGATAEGEMHESLNLAALWGLPVLFLCENNQYAMGTALPRHAAQTDLTAEPRAHGVPSSTVDGMDVLAVERATRAAVDAVRATGAPRFLHLVTYRFRAHSMYDPDRYREKDEIAQWRRRDPIDLLAGRMRDGGLLSDDELARIERDVAGRIEAAVVAAENAPFEPPEELERDVLSRVVP